MAQAGIHGMVGMAVRKWVPKKEWLMLGIVLGNMLPDMDALAGSRLQSVYQSRWGMENDHAYRSAAILT